MISVNTNFAALVGQRRLQETAVNQNQSIERLSTGLRINRAADDPSGLVISEKLRSQINGLNQALENTQNNINLINTAEGALSEISDILVDMRSSIIFAMNTGFSLPEQISAEQDKIDQALLAVDRIAQSTRFASRSLLNGESDFIIEQNNVDKNAVADLQVRQIRLSPSASSQNFSVNVTKLAERATLVFNTPINDESHIASLSPGGSSSDFVTLRVTGDRGTEDINFGQNATTQDLINSINQTSSSTGVYASSFRPVPAEPEVFEHIFKGTVGPGGLQVANGGSIVFGLQEAGSTTINNVVITDGDDDGIIADTDIATALTAQLPNSINITADLSNGDIRLVAQNYDFSIVPANNVRVMRFSAATLATAINDGGDASFDGVQFDISGSGAMDFAVTAAGSGGLDTQAERNAFLTAYRAANTVATSGAFFDPQSGDLVVFDTGNTMGAGAATPGILTAGDATAIAAPSTLVGQFSGGLSAIQMDVEGVKSTPRGIEFLNVAIPANHIDSNGQLAINVGAAAAFDFEVFDPETNLFVAFSVGDNGDGIVSLSELRTALRGGGLTTSSSWDVAFNEDKGLTFMYKNTVPGSGRFRVQTPAVPVGVSFQALTGLSTAPSVSNNERVALYSLGFGADQLIQLEDVTNSVSTLSLRSVSNGGLQATTSGRNGLGLFAGQASDVRPLDGGKYLVAGADVQGTINGMAFVGDGFDVRMVNSSLDAKFRMHDSWGLNGTIGMRADAVSFGLYDRIGGNQLRTSLGNRTDYPDNVLDTYEFRVVQSISGTTQSSSGMRFQIRESNSQQDAMNVGIRSVTTANLGLDVAPESTDANSSQRVNGFDGGSLSSLRTGAGNDLTTSPENALEILDAAIRQVTDLRGFLGSISKDTLQRNLNSASVALDNLVASESGIRDLDFAAETTEFARQQVLYAAGTSVLGQANQIPQQLLSLLQ